MSRSAAILFPAVSVCDSVSKAGMCCRNSKCIMTRPSSALCCKVWTNMFKAHTYTTHIHTKHTHTHHTHTYTPTPHTYYTCTHIRYTHIHTHIHTHTDTHTYIHTTHVFPVKHTCYHVFPVRYTCISSETCMYSWWDIFVFPVRHICSIPNMTYMYSQWDILTGYITFCVQGEYFAEV